MKPMTFEEWYSIPVGHYSTRTAMRSFLFDKARLGMIPEDGAIRIPPESEWPDDAIGVRVEYLTEAFSHAQQLPPWPIKTIYRSKPAWVPKVGEPVFTVNHDYTLVSFGKVVSVYGLDMEGDQFPKSVCIVDVVFPQGRGEYSLDHVKPGNITYIGKPWSEIPGDNE